MYHQSEEAARQERRANPTFGLFALTGFGMANWQYAPAVGWVLTIASILLILWFNWGQQRLRRWRLKRPFSLQFVDNDERLTELTVPANSEVVLELRYTPALTYREFEMMFGCDGPAESRPVPIRMHNPFVAKGRAKYESPDDDQDHFIDTKDRYHVRKARERVAAGVYTMGYVIKTKAPGSFPIRAVVLTEGGEGNPKEPLTLIVK